LIQRASLVVFCCCLNSFTFIEYPHTYAVVLFPQYALDSITPVAYENSAGCRTSGMSPRVATRRFVNPKKKVEISVYDDKNGFCISEVCV